MFFFFCITMATIFEMPQTNNRSLALVLWMRGMILFFDITIEDFCQ